MRFTIGINKMDYFHVVSCRNMVRNYEPKYRQNDKFNHGSLKCSTYVDFFDMVSFMIAATTGRISTVESLSIPTTYLEFFGILHQLLRRQIHFFDALVQPINCGINSRRVHQRKGDMKKLIIALHSRSFHVDIQDVEFS